MIPPVSTEKLDQWEEVLTAFTPFSPLPEDIYPRVISRQRRGHGYYITLGAIILIRSITPLSG